MSITTADLHEAIKATWDAANLDDVFKALWDDPADVDSIVLDDAEASPEHPWPYCVMDQTSGATTDRMSGGVNAFREVRDVSVRFNVHAKERDGDARAAKEIAAYLVEEVMKVFGGHPTVSAAAVELSNGDHLITQYQNDFGIHAGDSEYQWIVDYLFRLDVPVMI